MQNKRSISVEFWNHFFFYLSRISVFYILRQIIRNKSKEWWYDFVDIWVLSHLFFSIISLFIIKLFHCNLCSYFFVIYGFIRVMEIIIYQINVLLFDEYRAKKKKVEYKLRGYRRIIINLFNNFWEIIFWFSASYAFFLSSFSDSELSVARLIFNSFATMTTFGISNLEIKNETGLFILWFQSLSGLFMTLLSVTRFIGLLPKIESMDELEK